jgi:hypothetical protein
MVVRLLVVKLLAVKLSVVKLLAVQLSAGQQSPRRTDVEERLSSTRVCTDENDRRRKVLFKYVRRLEFVGRQHMCRMIPRGYCDGKGIG